MSDGVPKINDIGLKITLETDINLAGNSVVSIRFKKPSGVEGSWTATVENSPTGQISYTTASGDIDEHGLWTLAAHALFTGGNDLEGNAIGMTVKNRI